MRTNGTADMVLGIAKEVIGKAMQGVAEVLGSDRLKHKGAVQEAKGEAQKAMGKVKAAAGPVVWH
jgi:uncharacterized protein YjbJ (UPF0337 family)